MAGSVRGERFRSKKSIPQQRERTFTDVALDARVEDVGAGMSVSWFDCNNDGLEDLYVANMWTAAGERISKQEIFIRKHLPPEKTIQIVMRWDRIPSRW